MVYVLGKPLCLKVQNLYQRECTKHGKGEDLNCSSYLHVESGLYLAFCSTVDFGSVVHYFVVHAHIFGTASVGAYLFAT